MLKAFSAQKLVKAIEIEAKLNSFPLKSEVTET